MTSEPSRQPASYRVAVIGCGGIARAHANAYQAMPQCTIVAAADISQAALDGFGAQYSVPAQNLYTSYEEMLAAQRPDIVSVCTWPPLHPEPVIAAARAGVRGIVCEKPMATTLAEADRMNEAARASGSVFIVGHQRRFNERYRQARALIDAGTIGEVEEILAICGGDLLTDGTHAVDMTRFLAGYRPVEWVFGAIDLQPPTVTNTSSVGYQQWHETGLRYGHPVEGGALAQIQFQGGPRAILETGRAARPLGYQRFRVLGSEGRIEISGDQRPDSPDWVRVWGRGEAGWRTIELAKVDAFRAQMDALLHSLATGAPHPLSGESARATLEVLIGIMESAFRHERVTLPVDVADLPLRRHLGQAATAG